MGLEPGWLFVPSEYTNIQSAIDWALPGDIVVVAPGTYTGPGNRDINFLGKPITVRSIDPSDPQIVASTVIDCNGTSYGPHSGFYFHSGEDANSILSGFTITKGYGYEHTSGAILCDNSSPTVSNCTITGNGCTARSGCPSAGIQCYKSSPIISNCTISGNWSGYGGGIYCSQSNLVVTNCLFTGNSSGSGGGIYCSQSNLVVTNCLFTGNSSARGGGIYCCESNAVIDNCIFSGNSVESSGGAIYNYRGNLSLANATVTENSAKSRGGALYCDYSGKPTVNNSILYSNTAPRGPEIALDAYYSDPSLLNLAVSYSNVRGGLSAVAVEYPPRAGQTISAQGGAIVDWGPGNIDADPYFVDANSGDYHLKSRGWRWDAGRRTWTWDTVTSRGIDAGDPDAPLCDEPLFVPVDPTGYWGVNLRINMGVYGGMAEASIPPHDWAIRTDYNNDGIANFTDFACWTKSHQYTASEPLGPLNPDPALGPIDLPILAADWLDQASWLKVPTQASAPNPPDGSVGIRLDPVLRWEAGTGATSYSVYFGTCDPPTFQASTTATTFAPGYLSTNTTYYWRIDEVNRVGITTGPLWTFTTTSRPPR
jgi:predicted outer membrane repeat protein